MENIKELFSLPIGLTIAANIDGIKFYSSENLKKSFIKAFEKTGRGEPVAKDIRRLVDNGTITPCYLSKGLLRFLVHRTFGGTNKAIMGFYHQEIKKVYVLIDNNINVFGTGSSDLLVSTTMHECMHLLAGTKSGSFLSIFKNVLLKFYTAAFTQIFKLKNVQPAAIKTICEYLIKFENKNAVKINKELVNYYLLLEKKLKPFTTLTDDQFKKVLTDYIVIIKLYFKGFDVFVRLLRNYLHIIRPLQNSYQVAFGKRNTFTTPIQELVYPSEIACVYSEIFPTSPEVKKAFKALA